MNIFEVRCKTNTRNKINLYSVANFFLINVQYCFKLVNTAAVLGYLVSMFFTFRCL